MLIAVEDDSVKGYVSYKIEKKNVGKIIGVGVEPSYRNKGLATKLLKKSIKDLISKDIHYIYSRTWETNIASIQLHDGE